MTGEKRTETRMRTAISIMRYTLWLCKQLHHALSIDLSPLLHNYGVKGGTDWNQFHARRLQDRLGTYNYIRQLAMLIYTLTEPVMVWMTAC